MQASGDGHVYLAGVNYNADLLIAKFDSAGTPVWTKTFGDILKRELVFDMIVTDNHHLVIAASSDDGANYRQGLILILDSGGNQLVSKFVGLDIDDYHTPMSINKEPENGFSIAFDWGGSGSSGLKMMLFDSTGNVLRENVVSTGGSERMIRRFDGGYLIHEFFGLTIFTLDSGWTHIDGIGHQYFNFIDFRVNKIVQETDSDYYVLGSADYDGFIGHIQVFFHQYYQINWIKTYPMGREMSLQNLQRLNDGTYILHGTLPALSTSNPAQTVLIHADSLLEPLRTTILADGDDIDPLVSVVSTSLNGNDFLFSSCHTNVLTFNPEFFRMVRTDTSFSDLCDAAEIPVQTVFDDQYSTSPISPQIISSSTDTFHVNYLPNDEHLIFGSCSDSTLTQQEILFPVLNIYPNPCSTILHIKIPGTKSKRQKFYIYNSNGQIAVRFEAEGGADFILPVSFLTSGIYCIMATGYQPAKFIRD